MHVASATGFGLALRLGRAGGAWAVALLLIGAGPLPKSARPTSKPAVEPMWVNHIEPILSRSCFKCHGATKQKGGLDLRQPQSIFAGGTDGSVVIPGRPGESPLFQRLQATDDDHMPPAKEPQLTPEQISFVREWIAALPTSTDHPAITGSGVNWNQTAPSLMAMATRVKWEPPAGVAGSAAIDYLIQKNWQAQHVTGNGLCDDRTFVRRIYLDLAGRIPTPIEGDAFVHASDSHKRAALVDRLLSGNDYPRHLAEVLDVVLMERKAGRPSDSGRKAQWMAYLQSSIASGRPWNQMVADLIVARPKSAEQAGAAWFLYERKNNHQAMAEAVAPVALGVSVACAQCHNHPMAHEIKQQQYWGMVAAFNRSANVEGDALAVSESAVGGFVNFTNLKKESQPAILLFPNDRTVAEKRPTDGAKEQDADANYLVPPVKDAKGRPRKAAVPKFSRRQALADALTKDNPLLARAFVNRMWAMLLGRGFVNPVDQMDSRHLPSHPELLAWLASDFEKSGYDIRRLIRTIVLSQAYQLDSKWNGPTAPAPELFARGPEKPLSAEVLYRSLLVATGEGTPTDARAASTEPLKQALITAFPSLFDDEYNATLQQTMFLTNSPQLAALLQPAGENLTSRLVQMTSNTKRARAAFVDVLGRSPDEGELARAVAYLDARSERPEDGVRQLTWALLTSAEFLLNH
jgi:mono/diheme cytochrome c family protein